MQHSMQVQNHRLCIRNTAALFNPKTTILIQKRHPHTGYLNRETSGDSKNALFCIVEMFQVLQVC